MKQFLLKNICLICALFMTFSCLFSCTPKEEETEAPDNVITITFNSNGGTPVEKIEIFSPQMVYEPTAPTRENYIFLYWENSKNNTKWLFSHNEVKEDLNLTAVWIAAEALFKTEPAEDPNEILISGFSVQKNISILSVPKTIYGKTVVGFTDQAFANIHDSYAKKIIFPETIKTAGDEAFKDITAVHLEFLGAFSGLGVSTFEGCSHLESIKLAKGLTSIPYRCFFGASELTAIDVPEDVSLIEENAFSSCSNMRSIVLPSTLTKIEDGAFEDTPALEVIFFRGTEEQFESVEIAKNNDSALDAKIYFYSETEPTENGGFWHYDSTGTPILWE